MATSGYAKKFFAFSAAVGLSLGLAPLTATSAQAAYVKTPIPLTCRTNGAPMKYNVTRPMTGHLEVTAPDSVTAGENVVVRMQFYPEMTPGKENIATMKRLSDIALRFTLDDPSSFVTASIVGQGAMIDGSPKVSLVDGNMLVMSGMNVQMDGKDAYWRPPALDLVFTAPTDNNVLRTVHPAVEGPSGEFNNPSNAMTMKSTTESFLGELVIQLNCQAQSPAASFLDIPVMGGKKPPAQPSSSTHKTSSHSTSSTKGKTTSDTTHTNTSSPTSEAPNSDVSQGATTSDTGLSGWQSGLITVACLLAAGGVGYGLYRRRKDLNS